MVRSSAAVVIPVSLGGLPWTRLFLAAFCRAVCRALGMLENHGDLVLLTTELTVIGTCASPMLR